MESWSQGCVYFEKKSMEALNAKFHTARFQVDQHRYQFLNNGE
jgi:hypothetical protein